MKEATREELDRLACYDEPVDISMSFLSYNNGDWELIIRNRETGEEVCLQKNRDISEEDFKLLGDWCPACVWTQYRRLLPEREE